MTPGLGRPQSHGWRNTRISRAALRLCHGSQSEIDHLHRPGGRYHDVPRLQVAVNDALFVRGFERLRNLAGIGQRRFDRQRTFELFTLDQFHHQGELFDAVDSGDVGMVQRGEDLSFAVMR